MLFTMLKKIWIPVVCVLIVVAIGGTLRSQHRSSQGPVFGVSDETVEREQKEYIEVAGVEIEVGTIVSKVYDRYNVASRDNRYMQENLPTIAEWNHDYMLWSEATRMVVYLDPNRNDDLSEENRVKIDKIKKYIEKHPEKSLVINLYVRLTDVFEKADIPIEQFRAGWHYYHGEKMPPLVYGR